jgi:hypothetical protein
MSGLVQPKDLPAMASAASSKSRKMLGHLLQQDKSGGDGHKTETHVGKMAEHYALRLFTCHVTGVAEFFRFHHGGPVLFK